MRKTPAFERHMDMISERYPLLTREQERDIARKAKGGDQSAIDKLILHNQRFAYLRATKKAHCGMAIEDLMSAANLGLAEAVKRFDPERGLKFISYAVHWIDVKIHEEINRGSGTVKVPHHTGNYVKRVRVAEWELTSSGVSHPTDREVADHAGLDLHRVVSARSVVAKSLELDRPLRSDRQRGGTDMTFKDMIVCEAPAPDDGLDREDMVKTARRVLSYMDPRNREIFELRFGLAGSPDGYNLHTIGDRYGVSRERVRQIILEEAGMARCRPEFANAKDLLV